MECFTLLLGFLFLPSVCFVQSIPTVLPIENSSPPVSTGTPTVLVPIENSSSPPVSKGTPTVLPTNSSPPVSTGTPTVLPTNSSPPVSTGTPTLVSNRSSPPVTIRGRPIAPSSAPRFLPPNPPKTNLAAIIAGSIAGALFTTSLVLFTLVMLRKRKHNIDAEEHYIGQIPGMPLRFSYEELRVATDAFKEKVGAGGFGTVFKGVLGDGTNVAVKRLDRMTSAMREFLAEVESIGSIHHFNLTRLIGFCAEKSNRLLVYEYMCNGSLDSWIFDRENTKFLDWQTRKKIILDIAKGLAYLHEECRQRIIHLDIKPQNILLDQHFNAKVSDFGLSKVIDRDESQVQTTMRGTPGYLAPEWQMLRITVKVDIYSFGIVLLEIVCGRRNFDSTRSESSSHLLRMLQNKAKEDKLHEIVEHLHEDMENHKEEVVRMIKIGAWCLQDDHAKRPSMSTVVKVLEGVMEVEPNISYSFTHANGIPSAAVANGHVSTKPPEASVLSYPR